MTSPSASSGEVSSKRLSREILELVQRSTVIERAAAIVRRRTGAELDDLLSVGRVALLEIAPDFDAGRDVPFDAFVWPTVYFAMCKAAKRERPQLHLLPPSVRAATTAVLESATDPGDVLNDTEETAQAHLDDFVDMLTAAMVSGYSQAAAAVGGEEETVDRIDLERAKDLLRSTIDAMPTRPARLLRLRYLEGAQFDAIAEQVGESNATVRRHNCQALGMLGKRMRSAQGR